MWLLLCAVVVSMLPVGAVGATAPGPALRVILFVDERTYIASTPQQSGAPQQADAAPIIRDGATLVPIRLVAEALGAKVTWVAATREVLIDHGDQQIRLALDQVVATVTDGKATRSLRLAVPAQLVNDRTMVPVRAEGFGVPVQWDAEQRSVWIGYTRQEQSAITARWLTAGVEPRALLQAVPYLANGPFFDLTDYRRPVYQDPQTAAVIALDRLERKADAQDPLTALGQIVAGLNADEVTFATGEMVAAFPTTGEGVEIQEYPAGHARRVRRDGLVVGAQLFAWDWDLGLVLVAEGTRITDRYQVNGEQRQELNPYLLLGTPTQRVILHLRRALQAQVGASTNPLGLDPQEVTRYAITGSDAGLESFQVITDGEQGAPLFVVVTGGVNGFSPDYAALIRPAMLKLHSMDPDMLRLLVDRFGLAFFTRDIAGMKVFADTPTWMATYGVQPMGGIVFFNEDDVRQSINTGVQGAQTYRDNAAMQALRTAVMVESRGLYDLRHIGAGVHMTTAADRLNNSRGCDKTLWLEQQRQRLSGALDTVESNYLRAAYILGLRAYQAECDPPVAAAP